MPKGLQNTDSEILNRLKAKVAHSIEIPLNCNKNYDLLSKVIFDRTGAILSNSTLRRVFQYECCNKPTKSTLDLICKSIGFNDWDEFAENEKPNSQADLSQVITMFKLKGIGNHIRTLQILGDFSNHPNIFNLLETVVQIAILNRDKVFLRSVFEIDKIFNSTPHNTALIYFVHSYVISLNQSNLMPELIVYLGASKNAQTHLIEGYVDEDNLNGYFYDLLQVYHKNKRTPEAQLFYHCLMYQRAIENNLPENQHFDFIFQFDDSLTIHHIPKGRRYSILLLTSSDIKDTITDILDKAKVLFNSLNEVDKTTTALHMVKLLFIKLKGHLISKILLLAPENGSTYKNIDHVTNINQLKIYRAYSLFTSGETEKAKVKLDEFDPMLVHAFIYKHIIDDYKAIYNIINT